MTLNRRLAATSVRLLPRLDASTSSNHLLEMALKLFAERGYAATSVRDVAAAAGVKPPSIYAHFASKEHILAELCRIGHEEQYRGVHAAVSESRDDPRDQIMAYVRAHVGFHTMYPMLAVVSNSELHVLGDALGNETFAVRQRSEKLLEDIIRRGVRGRMFQVPDIWLAVAAIGGMGLRVAYWFAPKRGLSAKEVADGYAEFALRLLGARLREQPSKSPAA